MEAGNADKADRHWAGRCLSYGPCLSQEALLRWPRPRDEGAKGSHQLQNIHQAATGQKKKAQRLDILSSES